MAYVFSLEGFTPGQRYDDTPWTQARIEESASRDGPWVAVETLALDPVDTDPEDPRERSFTTDQATLPAGWFRVVFLDAAANTQAARPVYFPHPGTRPSLQDVGTILWARTKNDLGDVAGTFTDDTRPTADQVERLIDEAVADVAVRVGEIPEGLEDVAREAAGLRVAMTIERSFFPEQAADDNSAYQLFREDYLEVMGRLVEAAVDPAAGTSGVVSVPLTTTVAAQDPCLYDWEELLP